MIKSIVFDQQSWIPRSTFSKFAKPSFIGSFSGMNGRDWKIRFPKNLAGKEVMLGHGYFLASAGEREANWRDMTWELIKMPEENNHSASSDIYMSYSGGYLIGRFTDEVASLNSITIAVISIEDLYYMNS